MPDQPIQTPRASQTPHAPERTENIGELRIVHLKRVGSTMDEARARFRAIADSPTSAATPTRQTALLVIAGEQTAGRGTRGRGWASPPGGVWCTLALRDDSLPANARPSVLSIRVGMAIVELIAEWLGAASEIVPMLKWPNDVLLARVGVHERAELLGKVAGVLIERTARQVDRSGAVLIGMGINLRSDSSTLEELGGTSLIDHHPRLAIKAKDAGVRIGERVLDTIRAATSTTLSNEERERMTSRLWARGEAINVRVADGYQRGLVEALAEDGRLVVDLNDRGTRLVSSAADVKYA